MTGGQHRVHHQHAQHLLDPITSHRMYQDQESVLVNGSSPIVVDGNAFHDFTFPFPGLDQGHMMNLPDVSFGNHMDTDFAQHPGLNGNELPLSHHVPTMSVPPGSVFGAGLEAGRRGTSLDAVEDGSCERHSPTEALFEDGGNDDFGLPGGNRADGTDLGGRSGDDKSGAPPAWSELKTKAGKDRKRLPLACIACRRKKIRCSGEKPACKHCLRSRIPCVYKVTTRKAAPRTDYMAMLDKRLKRMEDRIIKIIPKADQDATSSITRAVVRPAILGTNSGNKSATKKRGAEEAFGFDLESWAKASVTVKTTDDLDENFATPDSNSSEEDVLSREGIDALPSKEIQEHLAEVFFDNVYGHTYHLLHKPSYMRKLKNNTIPPVLILSVCAVAARFATQPNIAGAARPFCRGEEWASHARDICTRRYEWPNMTVLTCLLILGLHEFGTCHGDRSWALGGQAIRMAFALQLHKDLEYDTSRRGNKTPLSFIDREIRRRIMWSCFLMDRFNSSGSDRPMFIKEESIHIQLPVKESYFQLDIPAQTELLDDSKGQSKASSDPPEMPLEENMGVAAYFVRAIAIWGRIVVYLHQGGRDQDRFPLCNEQSNYAKLVQQVDNLLQNLPESLQYSVDNLNLHLTEKTASQFLLLHLSIQQNALFLHKAAIAWPATPGDKETPSEFTNHASAKTVVAANKISEILKDAEQAKCNVTAPFAGYCAFSAANVHIFGIFSGNDTAKATAEVNAGINIKFLRKTMRYWGMFHWMVENIRTQYRNALEASRSGKLGVEGSGAWPVLQYADWFNRYPHGVSDFDVVEPTAQRRTEKGEDAVLEQKPELQSVEEYFTSLASPSSTESGLTGHGRSAKRKQNPKKLGDPMSTKPANGRTSDSTRTQSTAGAPKKPGQRATSRQSSAPVGGQRSGPVSAGYSPAPLSHVQTQPYTAMSPAQASPFPPGTSQPAFFGADMLQMSRPELPQGMGSRLSFGYSLSPGRHDLANLSAADWQAKNISDNSKMLDHDQHATKIDSGHAPSRHFHNQGQIGGDGLVEFNGSDLPAGWFMPFNMEPRVDMHGMNIPGETESSNGAIDTFNAIFGTHGIGMHQTMDGLRHSL